MCNSTIKRQSSGRLTKEQNGVFSRLSWDSYYFKWCSRDSLYAYCTKDGEFLKAAHHDYDNYDRSIVGKGVLSSDDIYKIDKPNKVVDMKDNNYIGRYNTVVEVVLTSARSGGSVYIYKASDEIAEDLKEDDLVVLGTDFYIIGKVKKIIKRSVHIDAIKKFNAAKAWIVCKVDETQHKERIANTERREFILTQLEEKKKEIEEVQIYQLIASMDPEANKLLEELKSLKSLK